MALPKRGCVFDGDRDAALPEGPCSNMVEYMVVCYRRSPRSTRQDVDFGYPPASQWRNIALPGGPPHRTNRSTFPLFLSEAPASLFREEMEPGI